MLCFKISPPQELEEPGEDTAKYDVFMPTVVRPPKPDIVMGSETLNSDEVVLLPMSLCNGHVTSPSGHVTSSITIKNGHMTPAPSHVIDQLSHVTGVKNGHMIDKAIDMGQVNGKVGQVKVVLIRFIF